MGGRDTRWAVARPNGVTGTLPVVVVLQNPQADDANESTRTAIADWAEGAGLPTIDVAAAFEDADSTEELLDGEINPSVAGSQLWAETVAEALG